MQMTWHLWVFSAEIGIALIISLFVFSAEAENWFANENMHYFLFEVKEKSEGKVYNVGGASSKWLRTFIDDCLKDVEIYNLNINYEDMDLTCSFSEILEKIKKIS